jgi:hypothetical protein
MESCGNWQEHLVGDHQTADEPRTRQKAGDASPTISILRSVAYIHDQRVEEESGQDRWLETSSPSSSTSQDLGVGATEPSGIAERLGIANSGELILLRFEPEIGAL